MVVVVQMIRVALILNYSMVIVVPVLHLIEILQRRRRRRRPIAVLNLKRMVPMVTTLQRIRAIQLLAHLVIILKLKVGQMRIMIL
jgi:hypothetical protein